MQDGYVCIIYYKGDQKMYDIITITESSAKKALKELVDEINEKAKIGWSLHGAYQLMQDKDGKFIATQLMTRE